MTLCLAWKTHVEAFFISDSRLTDTYKRVVTDDSPKVFKINVRIFDAAPAGEAPKLLHQTNFGMCFTGSYMNGSILADSTEEVLSNLQAIPQYSDTTMDNLSEIAFSIYKQISQGLVDIHQAGGLAKVLFGGLCPVTTMFRLYEFGFDLNGPDGLVFEKKEIKTAAGELIIMGDGKAEREARKFWESEPKPLTAFHILRTIIKDAHIPTVGGPIQVGVFSPDGFQLNGIMEYEKYTDEFGHLAVKDHWRFRGFSLNLGDNELRRGDVNILKTFLNPFENERIAYNKEVLAQYDDPSFPPKPSNE